MLFLMCLSSTRRSRLRSATMISMICRRRATRSASSWVASSASGLRLGRLDEAGDHPSVDRIGLGALAYRLGEMTRLHGIDDHQQ
jgi:hypothetical protein